MKDQFYKLEQNRKELADEYVQLKTSYMTLADERDREVHHHTSLSGPTYVQASSIVDGKKDLQFFWRI